MLRLKFQYSGHLMQRADSLEKTLILEKIEGKRRRGWWDGWMASLTQWRWVWFNLWKIVKDRQAWRAATQEITKSRTQRSGRTTAICITDSLETIICKQIWQPKRNGQISRNIKPTKIESKRQFELTYHSRWNFCCLVAKSCPTLLWCHGL